MRHTAIGKRNRARRAAARVVALLMLLTMPALADAPVFRWVDDTADLDLAFIRDGALVTNLNYPNARGVIARYTGVDLGEPPREVLCTARFDGGGAVAIIAGLDGHWSLEGITARSIHAVFTSEGYHFGFYEDGVLSDVLAGEYTLDTTGGTAYTFGFTISKRSLTLRLPTGGKDVKVDDRVVSLNGPYVVFEHYLTERDVERGASPAMTRVYAKGASLPALEDTFDRMDGLPVSAPSGHAYVQFRND